MWSKSRVNGSITVFMTIVFLLFFSVLGVAFEHVRVMASQTYIRVAAHSAAMTIFGNYNRELYKDYGLFAYGGYDGIGALELEQELQSCLEDNLKSATDHESERYTDFYRFQDVQYLTNQTKVLTDSNIFHKQIEAYLKGAAIKDLTQEVLDKVSGKTGDTKKEDKLAVAKDFEDGKYDDSGKKEDTEKEKKERELSRTEALKKDAANGNPLECFSGAVKSGILDLVCDTKQLSEGRIEKCDTDSIGNEVQEEQDRSPFDKKMGAAEYLDELLRGKAEDDSVHSKGIGANKIGLLCYADRQLSSYVNEKKRTTRYGLEYLVAGREKEIDNLAAVVNRLLAMRALLNFTYVMSSTELQSKSLATATVIAGFTGLTPVIKAVQYTILMILAFQEACVDVTALLNGSSIPFMKSAASFKMRYEEICMGSKSLFASKAKQYQKAGKKSTVTDISYEQYLWLFMLLNKESVLQNRIFDLIQYDLREKYNQSFCIHNCICWGTYSVSYRIPGLFQSLPFVDMKKSWNPKEPVLEVKYGYKSK